MSQESRRTISGKHIADEDSGERGKEERRKNVRDRRSRLEGNGNEETERQRNYEDTANTKKTRWRIGRGKTT